MATAATAKAVMYVRMILLLLNESLFTNP